jgi:hypothetical protein
LFAQGPLPKKKKKKKKKTNFLKKVKTKQIS